MSLAERDIVLVHTGRDAALDDLSYLALGPRVTRDATAWMFERGVRVMGIDAWGWDGPLHLQAQEALERDEPGLFWAAHQADLPYAQIERLANLGELPATGFQVACFPLPVVGASAAPARVVAIVPLAARSRARAERRQVAAAPVGRLEDRGPGEARRSSQAPRRPARVAPWTSHGCTAIRTASAGATPSSAQAYR